jgi:hypothetical protein
VDQICVLAMGDVDKMIWLFYIVLIDLRIIVWWLRNLFSNAFRIWSYCFQILVEDLLEIVWDQVVKDVSQLGGH